MDIQLDPPRAEGRYLVFTQCAASQAREWVEPSVDVWHGGRWHSGREVLGWVGPIPALKVADLARERGERVTAYDL